MSSFEQKSELQPVHRIFLGELFVFIVFFAGAMSVLVGPLAVPVATAGITIGAAVMLSAFCFLWLAFTTPMRKAEPRYAFMVLSLLPGLMICGGMLGYQKLVDDSRIDESMLRMGVLSLFKGGPEIGRFNSAMPASAFGEEIAALEQELTALGFQELGTNSEYRNFMRVEVPGVKAVPLELRVEYRAETAIQPEEYRLRVTIRNYGYYGERYFRRGDKWPHELSKELQERWNANMNARKAAKDRESDAAPPG